MKPAQQQVFQLDVIIMNMLVTNSVMPRRHSIGVVRICQQGVLKHYKYKEHCTEK